MSKVLDIRLRLRDRRPGRAPVPTTVPPGISHLEYLLRVVQQNLDDGRADVALTNLAQAVLVAHEKHEPIDQLDLRRRIQTIIRTGGGLA